MVSPILAFIAAHPDWAVLVIGLTAFGESFAFVSLLFPGTAILIAAGALSSTGALNPFAAAIAGIIGAVVGDAVSFWLGRKFGPLIPKLWPFTAHPEALAQSSRFFARYGGASVFIGRFSGPLRAVVPLSAGMLGMPVLHFYVANILSALIWAPALLLFGKFLGHTLAGGRGIEHMILFGLLVLAAAGLAILWTRKRFFKG